MGIFTELNDEQLQKAYVPIDVNPSGRLILVKDEQSQNASWSISFMLLGIVISDNEEQFLKALAPIIVLPSEIRTRVNEVQFWNPLQGI